MVLDRDLICCFEDGSYRASPEELQSLNLRPGRNLLRYELVHPCNNDRSFSLRAEIHLWKSTDKIVVVDIDGTVTKTDVAGFGAEKLGYEYIHSGVCELVSAVSRLGYRILFLTSRAITLAQSTREFLRNIGLSNGGSGMPAGFALLTTTERFIPSLMVGVRSADKFKTAALQELHQIFLQIDLDSLPTMGSPYHHLRKLHQQRFGSGGDSPLSSSQDPVPGWRTEAPPPSLVTSSSPMRWGPVWRAPGDDGPQAVADAGTDPNDDDADALTGLLSQNSLGGGGACDGGSASRPDATMTKPAHQQSSEREAAAARKPASEEDIASDASTVGTGGAAGAAAASGSDGDHGDSAGAADAPELQGSPPSSDEIAGRLDLGEASSNSANPSSSGGTARRRRRGGAAVGTRDGSPVPSTGSENSTDAPPAPVRADKLKSQEIGVFAAGFGNRWTDAAAYSAVGVPPERNFFISTDSKVRIGTAGSQFIFEGYPAILPHLPRMLPPLGEDGEPQLRKWAKGDCPRNCDCDVMMLEAAAKARRARGDPWPGAAPTAVALNF
eukprot:CAMPEP_0113678140 /NCGR_PEP_ID=MMETSP0038_2-20120614/9740_1 /TAXON_ID=2898 /ORGANISM="Cryptomonas paramecium" /LENGTH=553 /DNA_ID=CAMNT_0000595661 /DNA_START=266 /DNA_END=1928 /DNA_ORIENTATION=- /assembly_acc=CAM_ASM_000170